jgi:hypothetical protein
MKTVACSCGYVASGETAGELLADVEAHIDAAHRPDPAVPKPAATADRTGSAASTPLGGER